jgi:hypothetical protein
LFWAGDFTIVIRVIFALRTGQSLNQIAVDFDLAGSLLKCSNPGQGGTTHGSRAESTIEGYAIAVAHYTTELCGLKLIDTQSLVCETTPSGKAEREGLALRGSDCAGLERRVEYY